MPSSHCSVCKQPIVNAHCDSKTCTWCSACYQRKVDEGKQGKSTP